MGRFFLNVVKNSLTVIAVKWQPNYPERQWQGYPHRRNQSNQDSGPDNVIETPSLYYNGLDCFEWVVTSFIGSICICLESYNLGSSTEDLVA